MLDIDILEVLMNLISCHGFMKNKNSTVVLVCLYQLVNYHLLKGFVIIEYNSKHLISVPNEVKQRIHAIDKQKTDHVLVCHTEISSLANTLNILHAQSNFHTGYKQNLYNDKRDKYDELFYHYHLSLLKYIDHTALIQEWKQNLDAAAYENNLNK